ncbi:TonB-dependent receptor [Gallibacterium salpingitidis]|uniref:TonB-dependent receptor n=1 Tax=Gallibacterium salpingitidis TaxID=505341 RepID=UPI00266FF1FE|nr:TonB-dependent receptor [Gallibacterium salpingitidis]WKS98869.1 TonB-dependent receptor [Gallibacterium salpingitidis]
MMHSTHLSIKKKSIFLLSLLFTNLSVASDADSMELDEISVIGNMQNESALLSTSMNKTLDGFKLKQWQANTLGGTIDKIAGIQSSNFGPNTGTPVIRSLQGSRVQVLSNNLALSDLSGISPNLPLPIQPNLIRSIEVKKAGASILYGGRAVGGSVNIYDGRIPREPVDSALKGSAEIKTGYNSGNNQFISLDGGKGKKFAWHLDASNYYIPYYRIPGNAKFKGCTDPNMIYTTGKYAGVDSTLANLCQVRASMKQVENPAYFRYINASYDPSDSEDVPYTNREYNYALGSKNPANPAYVAGSSYYISTPQPIEDRTPNQKGRIPNSHLKRQQVAVGASYFFDNGYMGLGFKHFNTDYGVPGFASLSTKTGVNNAFNPININVNENKFTLDTGIYTQKKWLSKALLQASTANTHNGEFIGDVLSSQLKNQSQNVRLTTEHEFWKLNGSLGAEYKHQKITGSGADRYMPHVNSNQYALFLIERLDLSPVILEAGGRLEHVKYEADLNNYTPSRRYRAEGYGKSRHFALKNGFLGATWQLTDNFMLIANYTRTERAPEANELYASNTHFAIWAVELGDSNLNKEVSTHLEFGLNYENQGFSLSASWYQMKFKDYTYLSLSSSGEGSDYNFSIPIRYWRQDDNLVHGIELETAYNWYDRFNNQWNVRLFGDHVINKPTNKDTQRSRYAGNYLPGLPTDRIGVGLEWAKGNWKFGSSATYYFKQKNRGNYFINSQEPEMPAYTLVDALLSYSHALGKQNLEVYLDGRNLLNQDARPYNSPIKYLAPLPGRSVTLGMKVDF